MSRAFLLRRNILPLARNFTSSSSGGYEASQPFHLAVPVHNLKAAKKFYGGILKLPEGRSSTSWQDYDLYGNQLVCHVVGEDYRNTDYFNCDIQILYLKCKLTCIQGVWGKPVKRD